MSLNDAQLKATGSLSAQLAGARGGALAFSALPTPALAAQLAPFYKGDPGPQGIQGPKGAAGDSEMRWTSSNW